MKICNFVCIVYVVGHRRYTQREFGRDFNQFDIKTTIGWCLKNAHAQHSCVQCLVQHVGKGERDEKKMLLSNVSKAQASCYLNFSALHTKYAWVLCMQGLVLAWCNKSFQRGLNQGNLSSCLRKELIQLLSVCSGQFVS